MLKTTTANSLEVGNWQLGVFLDLVLMPQQPLLTDRTEFESALRSQPARRQPDNRKKQQDRRRDCDSEGADHGVIKIRSSVDSRKGI